MVRGANGRFASSTAAAPPVDELPHLISLQVEPIDFEPGAIPELPPPPEALPADDTDPGAGDVFLADALARGIDELVGLLAGATFKAEPDQVAAVGEAAAPVVRRVLSLVHADSLAESTVPAPVRELATLVARVYVAWGDAFVLIAQQQIAELRAQREAQRAEAGPTYGSDGGVRDADRDERPYWGGPRAVPPVDRAGEEVPPVGLDPRRAASIEHLSSLDARPRGVGSAPR